MGGRLLEPQAPLESLGLLRCGSRGEQEPAPWLGPHPEAGRADAPSEEDGQPRGREGGVWPRQRFHSLGAQPQAPGST